MTKDNQNPELCRTNLDTATDQSLLRRFRGGQDDAATALYVRYANRLRALAQAQTATDIAVRVDPEGVVQSVFRTFFRRAAAGQYDVPDGDELWKLFLVIALNKIRTRATRHRAAKRDARLTRPLMPSDQSITGDADEAFLVLRLTVEECLEEMPETHRQMVLLRIEGHDIAEIAQKTRRSKRSVERLLQGFRRRLDSVLSTE